MQLDGKLLLLELKGTDAGQQWIGRKTSPFSLSHHNVGLISFTVNLCVCISPKRCQTIIATVLVELRRWSIPAGSGNSFST